MRPSEESVKGGISVRWKFMGEGQESEHSNCWRAEWAWIKVIRAFEGRGKYLSKDSERGYK